MTTAPSPVRLFVVDDSDLVRHGLRAVVALHRGERAVHVVGEAGSVREALAQILRTRPDVVLLDVRLPDGSGIEACREILRACPGARVLILTSFASDDLLHEAVIAGAKGFLLKEIDPPRLVDSVIRVADGLPVLSPDLADRMLDRLRKGQPEQPGGGLSVLSPQERRVLELVAAGYTNRLVAQALVLSENTVKNYLVSVFEKLNVQRRTQAAAIYLRQQRS